MQETICTVGEVFLSGLERQPLLPQAAADEGLAGAELLFGPVPGGQPGQSDANTWQVCYVNSMPSVMMMHFSP